MKTLVLFILLLLLLVGCASSVSTPSAKPSPTPTQTEDLLPFPDPFEVPKPIFTPPVPILIEPILTGVPYSLGDVQPAPTPLPHLDAYAGPSLPGIVKDPLPFKAGWGAESSPVVFHGKLYLVATPREGNTYIDRQIQIYDYETKALVSAISPWNCAFGSAIVLKNPDTDNDVLYVFATNGWTIQMTWTEDLFHWSTPTVLFSRHDEQLFYNVSVAVADFSYIMTYEVGGEPGQQGYSFRALKSLDFRTWTPIGNLFSLNYNACPTVRYVDGYYQLIYLEPRSNVLGTGTYVSIVARTKDFITFEYSPTVMLAPMIGEGHNNSDVDLIEHNGKVYIVYLDGNQIDWDDLRTATFDGTIEELFSKFWE